MLLPDGRARGCGCGLRAQGDPRYLPTRLLCDARCWRGIVYYLPVPCPVPISLCHVQYRPGVSLHACYAMSRTDQASGAICLRACYAVFGTDLACGLSVYACPTPYPLVARIYDSSKFGRCVLGTALRNSAICLRPCDALSGYCEPTRAVCDVRCSHIAFCACYAMSSTDIQCRYQVSIGCVRLWVTSATCLRACYAMFGTELVSGIICPRACCAMSGTDIAYSVICLSAFYAMSGSDLAYAGTSRPGRHQPTGIASLLSPYAMSGADVGYSTHVLCDVRY
eukprot:2506417-Rhodomonas_salina.3